MSSTLLNTQKNVVFQGAGKLADPLQDQGPVSVKDPMGLKKWPVYANQSYPAGFGQQVEFWLPNTSHIYDVALECTFGTLSAGNWCEYPGLNIIQTFQLLDGSTQLILVDGSTLIRYMLQLQDANVKATILKCAGGTAFASGSTVVPLPMFFSRWIKPWGEYVAPLPAHKMKNQLKVRLTTRSAANLAAAGATVGSPTIAMNLWCWLADVDKGGLDPDANIPFNYQSFEFEALTGTSVATATATNIVCDGFSGNINCLHVQSLLSTDISTAHKYLTNQIIGGPVNLQINGDTQYYQIDTAFGFLYDTIALNATCGDDTTLGPAYIIQFGVKNDPKVYTGGLKMRDVQQLRVNVTQSTGSTCTVNVLAAKTVWYQLVNGQIMVVRD